MDSGKNLNNKEKELEDRKQSEEYKEEDENDNCEKLPSDYVKYDFNYKIIIIGDSGVGKTCLMNRAIDGEFTEKIQPTLGFEYRHFFLKYKEKVLKLEIWDTCGQEAYRSLIKGFFNNASLAIIVYGVNDEKTFDSINEWIRQCKLNCTPETKFILIGNKSDVPDEQ